MPATPNIVRWFKDDAACVEGCYKPKILNATGCWAGWPPFDSFSTSGPVHSHYLIMTVTWDIWGGGRANKTGTARFELDAKNGTLLDWDVASSEADDWFPYANNDWPYNDARGYVTITGTVLEYTWAQPINFDAETYYNNRVTYTLSSPHTIQAAEALMDDLLDSVDINNDSQVPLGTVVNVYYRGLAGLYTTQPSPFGFVGLTRPWTIDPDGNPWGDGPNGGRIRYALPSYSNYVLDGVHIVPDIFVGNGGGEGQGVAPYSSVSGAIGYHFPPISHEGSFTAGSYPAPNEQYRKSKSLLPYPGPYCVSTSITRNGVGITSTDTNGETPVSLCGGGVEIVPPPLDFTATPRETFGMSSVHFNSQLVGVRASGYFRAKNSGASDPSWNFSNNQTVTIGSNVYTFKTTLTNVTGYVTIGSNYLASLRNLIAAINGSEGSGTSYAALTVQHPDVTASETDVTGATSTLGNKAILIRAKASDALCSSCAAGNAIAINSTAPFLLSGAPSATPLNGNSASTLLGGIDAANGTCTDLLTAGILNG